MFTQKKKYSLVYYQKISSKYFKFFNSIREKKVEFFIKFKCLKIKSSFEKRKLNFL